jgi:hypothetical protein
MWDLILTGQVEKLSAEDYKEILDVKGKEDGIRAIAFRMTVKLGLSFSAQVRSSMSRKGECISLNRPASISAFREIRKDLSLEPTRGAVSQAFHFSRHTTQNISFCNLINAVCRQCGTF